MLSHYLYGCEPQYVVDIPIKLYAIHVIFVDILKFNKKMYNEIMILLYTMYNRIILLLYIF